MVTLIRFDQNVYEIMDKTLTFNNHLVSVHHLFMFFYYLMMTVTDNNVHLTSHSMYFGDKVIERNQIMLDQHKGLYCWVKS